MIQEPQELLDVEFLSVGSEYFINSQELEDKVRNLLPSQGGAGAGFDLSASTQIIPIIDLTESAEGSNLRQDLQTSLSFASCTAFDVSNATTTVISNTGYFRVFGVNSLERNSSTGSQVRFILNDGTTDKIIYLSTMDNGSSTEVIINPFDFIVFLEAGHSFKILANNVDSRSAGSTRQLASIDGTLQNP